MDKVTYATDTTVAVPGANVSASRWTPGATGNSTNGYFGGGQGPSAQMDKVTYSSDTTAAVPGANLSLARWGIGATGTSTNGYFGGGGVSFPSTTQYSRMDKVTYTSDTTAAVPGAPLSSARFNLAATGNSTEGYFGAGAQNPPFVGYATMDKVTYATDTTAVVPGAALSAAKYALAASSARANALPQSFSPSPLPNIV